MRYIQHHWNNTLLLTPGVSKVGRNITVSQCHLKISIYVCIHLINN